MSRQANHFADRPCWILGFPKSGTTLLLSLLDGHSALSVFPEELRFFSNVSGKNDRVHQILSNFGFKQILYESVERSAGGMRDYTALPKEKIESEVLNLPDDALTDRDLLVRLMEIWRNHGPGDPLEKVIWVEKTTGNEKNLMRMQRWFGSQASYLYIVRDPRDVYCSLAKSRGDNNKEGTPDTFAAAWRFSTLIAKWGERNVPNFKIVRYEDLVQQPVQILKEICSHLRVDFLPELLSPTRAGNAWDGNSMHGKSFAGISPSSIGVYRNVLSQLEIAQLERRLQAPMRRFRYDRTAIRFPSFRPTAISWVRFVRWWLDCGKSSLAE